MSQFSKSIYCLKSSILQLIFAQVLFAVSYFLEIIQVAKSIFSVIFLLLLFLMNFILADLHMVSLWPSGLCGFSTAYMSRILGREGHAWHDSDLAKFYFGVIFKTGAKRKKKKGGVGTCLRSPDCIITLLGSVICMNLMERGSQLWHEMTKCHWIQKHVTT